MKALKAKILTLDVWQISLLQVKHPLRFRGPSCFLFRIIKSSHDEAKEEGVIEKCSHLWDELESR